MGRRLLLLAVCLAIALPVLTTASDPALPPLPIGIDACGPAPETVPSADAGGPPHAIRTAVDVEHALTAPRSDGRADDAGDDKNRVFVVRVSGLVSHAGRPLCNVDLEFHDPRAPDGSAAIDWTLSDNDGRYEVALPPGGYVVGGQDCSGWITAVWVPHGTTALRFDIELP
ncbi:MAG: hypothetical protein KDC98_15270 [Planctomycetes bacterium]|nr:hypothetical protein [Planctomycetota bacterium]